MKKIGIIHYLPLEFYPPVTNLIHLIKGHKDLEIKVWSCVNHKNRPLYPSDDTIRISRAVFPKSSDIRVVRFFKYLLFNINCFIGLIRFNPNKICYFDSYSAWPVYWYCKLFGKNKELFIHFHEYFSPEWYKNGMTLVNYYHKLERSFLFDKASWISQTNDQRINLFVADQNGRFAKKMRAMPNYPPENWKKKLDKRTSSDQLRTIYIGSLSLKNMYLEAYCNWVISQKGNVLLDIYAYNLDDKTIQYLRGLNSDDIVFKEKGVLYEDIPKLLSQYDVGVILYKAYSENFKFNAPNKLFEYLTCNLQVWYSTELRGIALYKSSQVIPINFENLSTLNYKDFVNQKINESLHFTAEQALAPLLTQLCQ